MVSSIDEIVDSEVLLFCCVVIIFVVVGDFDALPIDNYSFTKSVVGKSIPVGAKIKDL